VVLMKARVFTRIDGDCRSQARSDY